MVPKTGINFGRIPLMAKEVHGPPPVIKITSDMRFTNKPSPSFLDRFHDVRQMTNNFNEHYLDTYTNYWISCLNESMHYFLDKLFSGFISVPRKTHPLGNEYHSIADGDKGTTVMNRIKI